MLLDTSLFNTQHYKVWIKGKVEQSWEGVAPSSTPWCSSYRKGNLWVTLNYGRQLYFYVIKKVKRKRKNIDIAWMVNKKAYDMIPQTWLIECLTIFKLSKLVINFLTRTIENWRVELTAGGQMLVEIKIQGGIFQRDTLTRGLVIAMMPLNYTLRKCKEHF